MRSKMERALRVCMVVAVMMIPIAAIATTAIGCADKTANITTEAGKRALVANEVLTRVERLQDAVIASQRNGSLPTATARDIVFVTVSMAEVADAAQAGWEASVRQVWAQAKRDIPYLASGAVSTLVAAIDELLASVPVPAPLAQPAAVPTAPKK